MIRFREIVSAFMVLFAVIDITGSIPIILDMKAKGRKFKPFLATIISTALIFLFLFVGEAILGLFSVDISSFAVAGSLVIFVLAVEMIFGIEIFKNDGPPDAATIVPLVFPLIAGTGTLTTVLSLRAEYSLLNVSIAIVLNMIIVYVVLRHVNLAEKLLGKGGIYILRKFFGIILLAIAVKLFASNVTGLFN
ncbi:MAG TPA: MarC family protein [Bacteroidales bacterium]|jgi:multiple antibiotic resistance protein|nr:MarC family protein [Bacteroidales bacterium]MCZ2416455.1 MarC family protein [Burkholderiales bacterium]OQC58048.1 MAG: putative antibiotic transporter [Bacteroidetes bacterium ADurb.Bin013]MCZ2315842.1 MarC family protein [Bacteroidales bacterium]NLZ08606.1 MarC family protein [Bacteroidales bacterium]